MLSGGQSRRMGQDKALLEYKGRPLIFHGADTLRAVFSQTVLLANRPEAYGFVDLPVLQDQIADCGPLGGLHAALADKRGSSVFLLACDLPLISPELVRFIHQAWDGEAYACVPLHLGRLQPLCAFYTRHCLEPLENRLLRGQNKVMDFLDTIPIQQLPILPESPFYTEHIFFNINTPENYEKLKQI